VLLVYDINNTIELLQKEVSKAIQIKQKKPEVFIDIRELWVLILRIQLKAILEKQGLVVQDDINLNPNIKKVFELVLQNI
jgi:hypothetical protein